MKYPIYVVSKGRWQNPLTAKFLMKENIDFKIAVEPQEYNNYCETIPEKNILKLPFSNLGLGSYPARNYCWEHSLKYKRHFLFDDNIYGFMDFNLGKRKRCEALHALLTLEKFTELYSNVGISGYNYSYFVTKENKKSFTINSHVYSGMLILNSLPFRWRLKYNEDVDLCLQILNTKKWCTILLNAYLIKKVSTVAKMAGGNQTELYKNNDNKKKLLKSKSLQLVWPQYVNVVQKYGRWHHQVSWTKFFKHPLIKEHSVIG